MDSKAARKVMNERRIMGVLLIAMCVSGWFGEGGGSSYWKSESRSGMLEGKRTATARLIRKCVAVSRIGCLLNLSLKLYDFK
jgi:hypothetical protein